MTTSTDSKKPVKAKGPVRTEAVVPIVIVFVFCFLYFHFFFDQNIRKGIEWVGTYLHGAEVNVSSIKTSFFKGSFQLRELQVTDKEDPKLNMIQIDEIRFGFLWDALLRMKFVVEDAAIDGIQVYSVRARPGYVRPPTPRGQDGSAIEELEKAVTQQTKQQFSDNALGHLASLIEGTDEKDVLNNIKSELKAEARIKAIQVELKEKEKAWKERIDKLPQKEEIESLNKRAKALKFNSKNPVEFAKDLKELGNIGKEADKIVNSYKDTSKNLKSDTDKFKSEFKQIDDLVKEDIKELEKMAKIPDLDLGDFSKNLFGAMFASRLVSVKKYMEVGRKYMPPPKDPNEKKKELIPPPRGAGENYKFPITKGYPLFWLKRAAISSKANESTYSGQVAGELTNVTTDPAYIKKPMVLDVRGDFPKAKVMKTHLKLTVDHIAEPKESLQLTIGTFPFSGQEFVSSSDLKLGVKNSSGSSVLNAQLFRQQLSVDLSSMFQQVEYSLEAKSSKVKEAVLAVLNGIPIITLNANATGSWENLDLHVNSNLGKELSIGLKRYAQVKVDEMKKKLKDLVDNRIAGEKEKLNSEYSKLKAQVDSILDSKKNELEKTKSDLKNQAKAKENSSKDKVKSDLKEKGKKLLKGIKF